MIRLAVPGSGSHSTRRHGPALQRCQQEAPDRVELIGSDCTVQIDAGGSGVCIHAEGKPVLELASSCGNAGVGGERCIWRDASLHPLFGDRYVMAARAARNRVAEQRRLGHPVRH